MRRTFDEMTKDSRGIHLQVWRTQTAAFNTERLGKPILAHEEGSQMHDEKRKESLSVAEGKDETGDEKGELGASTLKELIMIAGEEAAATVIRRGGSKEEACIAAAQAVKDHGGSIQEQATATMAAAAAVRERSELPMPLGKKTLKDEIEERAAAAGARVELNGGTSEEAGIAAANVVKASGGNDTDAHIAAATAVGAAVISNGGSAEDVAEAAKLVAMKLGSSLEEATLISKYTAAAVLKTEGKQDGLSPPLHTPIRMVYQQAFFSRLVRRH